MGNNKLFIIASILLSFIAVACGGRSKASSNNEDVVPEYLEEPHDNGVLNSPGKETYVFSNPGMVFSYLRSNFTSQYGRTISLGSNHCLYVDGQALTMAMDIVYFNDYMAELTAISPLANTRVRIYVNCQEGYVQDANSNERFYLDD